MILIVDRPDSHELKTEKAAQPVICPIALAPLLSDWLSHRDDSPPGWSGRSPRTCFGTGRPRRRGREVIPT